MKSLLNYIGKKNNLDILTYIDKGNLNINTYCEPFSGGFSAGLNLIEQGFNGKVILNDLDDNICNFWICLRDDWEGLFECANIMLAELSRYTYKDDMLQIIKKWQCSNSHIEKAVAEYVYRKCLTMQGMSIGLKKFNDTEIDFFIQSQTLKNVIIENCDYVEILHKYDSPDTFFMMDPPYYVNNVGRYYRCESEFFYHRQLRECINNLKSKVLITYNKDDYIMELYRGFEFDYIKKVFIKEYFELYFRNFSIGG